ncbi:MAG: hypothetical protein ACI9KN_001191 [Gammaproteobacteria bacterium]|jgi:hypothetical protein
MDIVTNMYLNNFSPCAFLHGLFKNRKRKVALTLDNIEYQAGESDPVENPFRSAVYEIKTTRGWRVIIKDSRPID